MAIHGFVRQAEAAKSRRPVLHRPRGHMAGGPNYGFLAAEPQSAKGRDT